MKTLSPEHKEAIRQGVLKNNELRRKGKKDVKDDKKRCSGERVRAVQPVLYATRSDQISATFQQKVP